MRFLPRLAAATACLLLLASCVGPSARPAPAPEPAPTRPIRPPSSQATPRPAPPLPATTAWADRPLSPGSWTYRADPTGPAALFGPPGAAPRLTVRCDRAARRILFVRPGVRAASMTVRTSYGAQPWPAAQTSAAQPETIAARAASDGGLDQIAYSRGKFAVEVPGLDPLILPAWAEVARVIEDCRG